MTKREAVAAAAEALVNGTIGDPAPRFAALRAALALPPDPPGECCRRAVADMVSVTEAAVVAAHGNGFREGAEAMRNRARDHFIRLGEPHLGEIVGRLPLPGAKEGA